jgi:hypothetical protein
VSLTDAPKCRHCNRAAVYCGDLCRYHGAGQNSRSRAQFARAWIEDQLQRPESELARTHRNLVGDTRSDPYLALLEQVRSLKAWLEVVESQLTDEDVRQVTPRWLAYERLNQLLHKAAKYAADAHVAERHVQLAELQGALLYRVLDLALATVAQQLGWDQQERQAFAQAFGPALRAAFETQTALPPPTTVEREGARGEPTRPTET